MYLKHKFAKSILAAIFFTIYWPIMSMAAGFGELNITVTGLALRGYDPVSFQMSGPLAGSNKITAIHEGATYHFVTKENKAKFLQSPASYLPKYGGFCAKAIMMGFKVDADPKYYVMDGNELYLFSGDNPKQKWLENGAEYTMAADQKWPEIQKIAPADLK